MQEHDDATTTTTTIASNAKEGGGGNRVEIVSHRPQGWTGTIDEHDTCFWFSCARVDEIELTRIESDEAASYRDEARMVHMLVRTHTRTGTAGFLFGVSMLFIFHVHFST